MATRNTIYVVRVGTETPQGDGYTYLRWCDGEDYRWADRKDAIRLNGRSAAHATALWLLKAMRARSYDPPVRVVPAGGGAPTGFCPEKILGKIWEEGLSPVPITL
jgi:hypothetical protein